MKIVIAGAAGGIGQPLTMLLKVQLPTGSVLSIYDVVPAINGVAADVSHISTGVKLESYLGDMKNPNTPEVDKAMKDADIVVIPAGVPRKPGMTRDDLFKINAGIVKSLVEAIVRNCPKAFIAIITNPVNSTVPVAAEILKKHGVYNSKKLFGVSTLDVVRAQTFIGELKGLDPAKVQVDVIGGHSAETMIPVLSQVPGVQLTDQECKDLTKKIQDAGTVVVNAKEGAGSATLSMAYAGARFTHSLVRALQGETVRECSYVEVSGLSGIDCKFFGIPIEIGKEGITKIHPIPKLSESEQQLLKEIIPPLKQNIETGITFGQS